ncbi:MAG: alpha/beta hydrolase [Burkholderiales bacterium]|nr:alpha/beta hydrolase [Burkholderiales bacterium]
MPTAHINGAEIPYEVLGSSGPWVALTPGGRRGMAEIRSLAARVAAGGCRVLIHDRRNCGAAPVSVGGGTTEHEVWADDLHALLQGLNALPAVIGGSSSGCRMSIDFALRYPQAVRGLLLWRVTGGAFAVSRLTEKYYGEFIRAAREGGMAAVCQTEHFRELIAARPANREALMAMDPAQFIAEMNKWDRQFRTGDGEPVIGASAAQLQSITVPACVVPGNDRTHPQAAAENLARLMPKAELQPLMGADLDADVDPAANWDVKEAELAAILTGGLRRIGA